MAYIEILGVMGTGKSALSDVFNERAKVHTIVEKEEDLKRLFFVEPYLSNPEKYGFEGSMNFIAFHLNRIQEALHKLPEAGDVVVDTSLLMQYAYHRPVLREDEMNVVSSVLEHSYEKLPKVDLRIVLTLPIDVHMDRIKKRGRESEAHVPKEWLESVQKHIDEAIEKFGKDVPTIYLDGSKLDWVHSEEDKNAVMDMVREKLPQLRLK